MLARRLQAGNVTEKGELMNTRKTDARFIVEIVIPIYDPDNPTTAEQVSQQLDDFGDKLQMAAESFRQPSWTVQVHC